ncbi:hypothetical protein MMC29_000849 [Sticta canariensis]|nr:hypothetical protein [Sticta canariensis]
MHEGKTSPLQVRTAIANLETKKAALMRNVAVANRADTERVCEGSRMNPPALPAGYVQAIQAGDGERIDSGQVPVCCARPLLHMLEPFLRNGMVHLGQSLAHETFFGGMRQLADAVAGMLHVAEVLHKTMEQLSAMQDLASKRQPLLASIDALDATLAEIGWMRAWKCDANRFSHWALCGLYDSQGPPACTVWTECSGPVVCSILACVAACDGWPVADMPVSPVGKGASMRPGVQGRLVGQSISRAGKAEEMDKHLPAAFAELRAMLQDWAVEHGGPFLVNGSNYLNTELIKNVDWLGSKERQDTNADCGYAAGASADSA